MKTLVIIIPLLFCMLATASASLTDASTNVAGLLRKLALSTSKDTALVQDLDGELDDDELDDDDVAKMMTNAVFSTLMEDGDDGEGSIMADLMGSDKEAATQWFRTAWRVARGILRHTRYCRRRG